MSWTKFKPFTDFIDIQRYTGYEGRPGEWMTRLERDDLEHFSQAEGVKPKSQSLLDWCSNNVSPCGLYFIRVKDESAVKLTKSGFYDYIGMASGEQSGAAFQRGIFGRLFDHYRKLVNLPERGKFNTLIQKYQLGIEDSDHQRENKPVAIKLLKDQHFYNIEQLRIFFASPHLKSNEDGKPRLAASWTEYGTTEYFLHVFKQCRESNNLDTLAGIQNFFRDKVELSFFIVNGRGPRFTQKVAKGEGLALATYIQEYGETPYLNKSDEVQGFNTLPKDDE
tara:strand:+ start:2649 stop:3485 length:837 start_codon:yes stop_codon:yes gene_type:complete